MRIFLNNTDEYSLDLKKLSKRLQERYLNFHDKPITLKNGKKFDFSRKSVMRTGVKTLLAPFLLNILQGMYEENGFDLPPHVKHSDLIDYIVMHSLRFITLMDEKSTINVETVEDSDSNIKRVTSLHAIRKTDITSKIVE